MRDKKILIVDDSEFNRMLLVDILENQYIVEQASDGEEAMEILGRRSSEFLIVLLDIVMPKETAFQFLSIWANIECLRKSPLL